MFDQIFRKSYTIKKHIKAPLYKERLQYIKYWYNLRRAQSTLASIAQYLLRIIDYIHLENKNIVTIEEIEKAADLWARYQFNHPQKRSDFTQCGKERFTWYAVHWLKQMGRLAPLPEEQVLLFSKIFKRSHALKRHVNTPLLEERLKYLQYWSNNGAVDSSLRRISQYLLIIMQFLDFYKVRTVSLAAIEEAAEKWAIAPKRRFRKDVVSKFAKARFIRDAVGWFKMLGCLEPQNDEHGPFEEYLDRYMTYMHDEQGLSKNTTKSRFFILRDFLAGINIHLNGDLENLTPLDIDEVLIKKHNVDHYSRRSVQHYASVVRSFLKYAENKGWCNKELAGSVKAPRVYRYEQLPYSPSWEDVKKVIANSKSERSTDIRDYAILILLSVYGLRCSEVTNLCLEDFDWRGELLHLRRAKRSKPQTFPLIGLAGEAILSYLKKVRPKCSFVREVFLCTKSPYRPLTNGAMYQIVSKKLKPLNLKIKHYGPHALRHACATHLINVGVSLKEISDHLGHKMLDTTRIYTKIDLTSLRKVAELELGDLL